MKPKKNLAFLFYFLLITSVVSVSLGIGLGISLLVFPEVGQPGGWQALTPIGPTSVRTFIALDHNTILAGLQVMRENSGGLIKTSDRGKSWQRQPQIPSTNQVTAIIRPDKQGPRLFLSMFNNDLNGKGGVYCSEDLGNTWTRTCFLEELTDVRSLAYFPGKADHILAGTVRQGVFVSQDRGLTWTSRNSGLTSLSIQHVAVNPLNPDLVFAATNVGLFRSNDRAASWHFCPLSDSSRAMMCLLVVCHPSNPAYVYALERPQGPKTLIWQSHDTGLTWQLCGRKGLPAEFHPRYLTIDPYRPETIYLATVYDGIYVSTNGGQSWLEMNRGFPVKQANIITHVLGFWPINNGQHALIAGTDYQGTIYVTPLHQSLFQRFALYVRSL
ncbi:hypothetical protein JXQ70_17785 [bacterium]|nr:hypothetical protein [bacterium]